MNEDNERERLQSIRYRRERGTTPRPEDVDWLLARVAILEQERDDARNLLKVSERAGMIQRRDDIIAAAEARIVVLREALQRIESVCTKPRDSMRNRLNDCVERGNAILGIVRRTLAVDGTPPTHCPKCGEALKFDRGNLTCPNGHGSFRGDDRHALVALGKIGLRVLELQPITF